MAATNIDAVIGSLVALAEDATGLQVLDGPILDGLMWEHVVIGFPDGEDSSYTVERSPMPGLRQAMREDWSVRCLLSLTTGASTVADVRGRAVEALTALEAAVAAASTTSDLWDRARVEGRLDWFVLQHSDGVSVNVLFSVSGTCLP